MLRTVLASIFTIQATTDDAQRRARNVIVIALGMIALAVLSALLTVNQERPLAGQIAIVIGIVVFAGVIVIARAGYVLIGSLLIIAVTTLAIVATLPSSNLLTTPFYLTLAVMVAGATLRPVQIWLALAGILGALWFVLLLPSSTFLYTALGVSAAVGSSLLLIMAALLTFLTAQSAERAILVAQEARKLAQLATAETVQSNSDLERKIAERTQSLSAAYERERSQTDELRASIETQRILSQTILDLAMPVIPLNDHVLIVPLIGNIDSNRANQLLSQVLEQVERRRARGLILDVTGISVIDTAVAQTLLRVADANRLLGARTVMVGIRPEVAQTLVTLGVDLQNLLSAGSLQEGLQRLEA